nr:MAG TPA: hypothetical protein [Caudoviricetes sp.]
MSLQKKEQTMRFTTLMSKTPKAADLHRILN